MDLTETDQVAAADRAAFKAKLQSLSFGFRDTKAVFHGPTIRERQHEQESDYRKTGRAFEKLSTRAELI